MVKGTVTSTRSNPAYCSTRSRSASRHCRGVVVPQVLRINRRFDTNMLLSLEQNKLTSIRKLIISAV